MGWGWRGKVKAWLGADAPWSVGPYRLFRLVFGLYLLVHFAQLAPWAAELFSSQGMLPDASSSPLVGVFPNVLGLFDAPWFCVALVGFGAVLSGMLAVGWRDRAAALVLWVIWASLFGRNPLISNPGLPYVGLLLMVHALTPAAGALWERRPRGWAMSGPLFVVVWVLMAVGYSYSGVIKLVSPSWLDGTAMVHVLEGPLGRGHGSGALLLSAPSWVLKLMTWGALGLELCFAPLALSGRLRPWLWVAGLGMHLGLIVLVDFADLSLGMVMLHLFTFDLHWVERARLWRRRHNGVPRPSRAEASTLVLGQGHA